MKKLLVLGGFPQMIDIVMTAREMGAQKNPGFLNTGESGSD